MNDDGNGEVIKYTDLTHEVSTDRAAWSPPLVETHVQGQQRWYRTELRILARITAQQGADHAVPERSRRRDDPGRLLDRHPGRRPRWPVGTVVTIIFYLLVHFTSGQRKRK